MADHVCTIKCAVPSFEQCAAAALSEPEFIANWNRLRPEHPITIMRQRTGLDALIDKACNVPPVIWSDETKREFFDFCRHYIWRPVAMRVLEELRAAGVTFTAEEGA